MKVKISFRLLFTGESLKYKEFCNTEIHAICYKKLIFLDVPAILLYSSLNIDKTLTFLNNAISSQAILHWRKTFLFHNYIYNLILVHFSISISLIM